MTQFNHPNILNMVGVCLDGGPAPFIIMPFMANGSLLAYLKRNRPKLVVSPENEDDEDVSLNHKVLLSEYTRWCCDCTGERCVQAADGHVPSDCDGNGVPCKDEDGS